MTYILIAILSLSAAKNMSYEAPYQFGPFTSIAACQNALKAVEKWRPRVEPSGVCVPTGDK